MKVVDLNLILYAVNQDAPDHLRARNWWEGALNGSEQIGLPWVVVLGFLRIATRPGIFNSPVPIQDALAMVDGWLTLHNVVVLNPGRQHWGILRGLLDEAGTAGNLTTDAHIAALAMEYQGQLYSSDRDFRRFGKRLSLHNPLSD